MMDEGVPSRLGKKENNDESSAEVINRVKMTAVRQRELQLGGFFFHTSQDWTGGNVSPQALKNNKLKPTGEKWIFEAQ